MTMEHLTSQAKELRLSPTLEINELVQTRLSQGKEVVHLGFGEATFPIHENVLQAHSAASRNTSYLPVAGLMKLREVRPHLSTYNSQSLLLIGFVWSITAIDTQNAPCMISSLILSSRSPDSNLVDWASLSSPSKWSLHLARSLFCSPFSIFLKVMCSYHARHG